METQFLKQKIALKFSTLLDCEIPVDLPVNDVLQNGCARLYFDGTTTDSRKLKMYNFSLRCFDENWDITDSRIYLAEKYLKNSTPEIFSNGNNNFCIRYYNVISTSDSVTTSGGAIYCCSEIKFSVML